MGGAENKRQERLTYLSLMGLFASLFGLVVLRERGRIGSFALTPTDLALLGLATYRAGRLAAYDRVTEPFSRASDGNRA